MHRYLARLRPSLLRLVDKGTSIRVEFELDAGGGKRTYYLDIPARTLIDEPMLEVLDRAARKKLNEHWDMLRDGAQPQLPW